MHTFHGLLGLLYPCRPGFWGEAIKVPINLPRKDERFANPWRGLNSKHYVYKLFALPTELYPTPGINFFYHFFLVKKFKKTKRQA